MTGEPEVLCERRGSAGLITLNRPKALNAITLGMVRTIRRALDAWAGDTAVALVIIVAAGDRAFSAGGDIRDLYDLGRAGRYDEALSFWREEYALNLRIKRYPKPYVALIDGLVMGGGVGVSLHGSHRIAGDRYRFAMPEVGIGFFPDVGATYALPRLPGRIGTYLGLTGARVGAADALGLGLATHRLPSAEQPHALEALIAGHPVDNVLPTDRAGQDGDAFEHRALIDGCFGQDTVFAILASLDQEAGKGSAFARETAAAMRSKSPTSLAIA
ncbi:MAG: 3-hydroxyisobutyryl-CoA hydrolase, partial [uncultured Microvirga sp.]